MDFGCKGTKKLGNRKHFIKKSVSVSEIKPFV
jgi:hypothetical protein